MPIERREEARSADRIASIKADVARLAQAAREQADSTAGERQ
jgi:hypothetical protein